MFLKSKDTFKDPAGWVFYDGQCSFCTGWIKRLEHWLHRLGFGLAPLQTDWVQDHLKDTGKDPLQEMKLLSRTGKVLGGVDAWLYIARKSAWTWPLYFFGHLPGIYAVLENGYRWIARNRYRLGEQCTLPEGRRIT